MDRDAPPGFRIWGGATVDAADVARVLEFASPSHLTSTAQRVCGTRSASLARLRTGDIIRGIDDRKIDDATELVVAIRSYAPGDRIEVTFERDTSSWQAIAHTLAGLAKEVAQDMKERGLRGRTVTVKVRFVDREPKPAPADAKERESA